MRNLRFPAAASILSAALFAGCVSSDSTSDMGGGESQTGRTGSMARFQVVGDHLYALSGNSLHVYGIADPAAISFQNSVDVGFGIETLFARGSALYIGSQTGMHIYSIADRAAPVKSSEVTHFRSCDPVVVEGDLAFVTLRSGGAGCWNGTNELQIHDVSNPAYPVKLKTYPMANPHGLGTDGDRLFLCDGYAGLKVYRVGADRSISLIERVDGIETYDVIPRTGTSGKILVLVAKDGLYQYDYGVAPMKELSVIKIGS
jgi:hypothetical protein